MTELRLVESSDAGLATLELISQARACLAEAKTVPDLRRLMAEASVVEDAAKRAARLFNAERRAAGIVEAAALAANDAAAVRIEAQAKAGELLRQMRESGEREATGRAGEERVSHAATPPPTLGQLGLTRSESSRWQQVADVPEDVRHGYVEETKAAKGEVSTAGLLRHAKASGRESQQATVDRPANQQAAEHSRHRLAEELYRAVNALPTYPPALVAELEEGERQEFHRTARRVAQWFGYLMAELRRDPLDGKGSDFERMNAVHTAVYELRGLCVGEAGVQPLRMVDAVEESDRPLLLEAVRDIGAWLAILEGELLRQGVGEDDDQEDEQ